MVPVAAPECVETNPPVIAKGKHLIMTCTASKEVLEDDKTMLEALAEGARVAGANVISQLRYRTEKGFSAVILLDESHCSAHTVTAEGLIHFDFFTCGATDPARVFQHVSSLIRFTPVFAEIRDRFVS